MTAFGRRVQVIDLLLRVTSVWSPAASLNVAQGSSRFFKAAQGPYRYPV